MVNNVNDLLSIDALHSQLLYHMFYIFKPLFEAIHQS